MIREDTDNLKFRGNPFQPSYEVSKKVFNSLVGSNFQYKKDTTFEVFSTSDENRVVIVVKKLVICLVSNNLEPLSLNIEILSWEELNVVLRKIYNALVYLETHEIREHFKIKNNHYIDPHPEKSKSAFYNSGTLTSVKR